jgi:hypothetical protein
MFAQMDHGKPIVNGYSSYFPPGYTQFQFEMMRSFPNQDLLCSLSKGLQVNTLVADQDWLKDHKSEMEANSRFLQPVYNDSQVQIYRLQAPEGECKATDGS